MTLLWKPTLSATLPIDPETGDFALLGIPFPVYASPKIDGFRVMVQRATLVSRNGLPVRNRELQARYGRREYEGLDGELTDGPPTASDVFNRTSKVATKAAADAHNTQFNVIDWFGDFELGMRYSCLKEASGGWRVDDKTIRVIKQTLVHTVAQLKAYEAKTPVAGYEGVMLRRAGQGAYVQKRSTLREFYLVRLKRFEYAEAVIVGVKPLMHNLNTDKTAAGKRSSKKAGMAIDADRVGSAVLRDCKTGVEFDTTVGAERLRTWKGWPSVIGMKVRYKYQACGTKDKPRINTCAFAELAVTS
jgi:DNA ligase 1